jgi:hypothetical protein
VSESWLTFNNCCSNCGSKLRVPKGFILSDYMPRTDSEILGTDEATKYKPNLFTQRDFDLAVLEARIAVFDRVANHYAYLADVARKESRAFGIYEAVSNTCVEWAAAERANLQKQKAVLEKKG